VHRHDQRVHALGVLLPHGRDDVARVVHHLARAERADPPLVLGQTGRDDRRPAPGGELNGVVADSARGSDDEDEVALGRLDSVDRDERRHGREANRRRLREVELLRLALDEPLRGNDHVLGVRTTRNVRFVRSDARDLVADAEPRDALADRIDHPGEVLPDDDRVPMLHHASGHPRGHERVVSVHGGLANADPHLARTRLGGRDLDRLCRRLLVRQSERLHASSLTVAGGSPSS
jgi:hypothetical protein